MPISCGDIGDAPARDNVKVGETSPYASGVGGIDCDADRQSGNGEEGDGQE
jgi:hypothetical protein